MLDKQEDTEREPYKKIANSFIQNVITNSNETALKMIWYIASMLKNHNFDEKYDTHTFSEADISKQTGIKIPTIRKNLQKMQKTTISFIDEEQEENRYITLLPDIKIKYDGTVEIDINTKIARQIAEVVSEKYTFIDINQLLKLKNKHSIRLLPLLKTISEYKSPAVKTKTVDLDYLNQLFGTTYKRIKTIEVEILVKIKTELDKSSSLTFDYELIKKPKGKGRPAITGIKLIPKKLDTEQHEKQQTLDDIKRDKYIQIANPDILKEIEKLVSEQEYITEMKIFIAYCIENNKIYSNYGTSFLRHLRNRP